MRASPPPGNNLPVGPVKVARAPRAPAVGALLPPSARGCALRDCGAVALVACLRMRIDRGWRAGACARLGAGRAPLRT